MKVILRSAKDVDSSAVAEIFVSSRRIFIPYAPMAHSASQIRHWIESTLIPSAGVTVACVSEEVVGFLSTSEENGIGWIDHLYVSPGFVGQGIGTRLLKHGLAFIARPVRLHTFQANLGARRFYETHGFKAIEFTDGGANEERCPDVLLELATGGENAA